MAFEHLQEIVFAHPDNIPHSKSCEECAFRKNNPQNLSEEDFDWLEQQIGSDFTFYCNHRLVDGYSRPCAAWVALNKENNNG